MEKNSKLFDRWFWLWQLGLAEDPEISVLITEVPDYFTEYYRRIEVYLVENEELRIVKGVSTIEGPFSSNFWLGPVDSIGELKTFTGSIIDSLEGTDKPPLALSRHWCVTSESGRLQCEDWKNLYLKQKGLGKLD